MDGDEELEAVEDNISSITSIPPNETSSSPTSEVLQSMKSSSKKITNQKC